MNAQTDSVSNYEVINGNRRLTFTGERLAVSTSWTPGAERWVEFGLYRTESGQYVLSRIGRSKLYHSHDCVITRRNNLDEIMRRALDFDAVPCARCRPELDTTFPAVCPERQRYWGQLCTTADAVISSLQRLDDNGSKYMTNVAQRLVEEAAQNDSTLLAAYSVEVIT